MNYLEAPLLVGVRIKGNFINFGISPALLVAQNFVDTFDNAEQKKTRIDLASRFNANIILDYNHMSSSDYPLYFLFRLFYSPISPFKEYVIDGYNFKTQSFGGTFGIGITF